MAYQPQPIKTEGGQKKTRSADDSTQQLLEHILLVLNQINIQLALMTDTTLSEDEQL